MPAVLLAVLLMFPVPMVRAASLEIEGMQVAWEHRDGGIEFILEAPTQGWVAIGFNEVNSIVGADLIMAGIRDGQTRAEHLFVEDFGAPRPVRDLGRASKVRSVRAQLQGESIAVALLLDQLVNAELSRDLHSGREIYLIVAYSISPDFDHHSRMRRHLAVKL